MPDFPSNVSRRGTDPYLQNYTEQVNRAYYGATPPAVKSSSEEKIAESRARLGLSPLITKPAVKEPSSSALPGVPTGVGEAITTGENLLPKSNLVKGLGKTVSYVDGAINVVNIAKGIAEGNRGQVAEGVYNLGKATLPPNISGPLIVGELLVNDPAVQLEMGTVRTLGGYMPAPGKTVEDLLPQTRRAMANFNLNKTPYDPPPRPAPTRHETLNGD